MNTRAEIGRLFGIPIYLDMFFVLVMVLFTHRYFTSGDMQLVSAGLLIIAGLMLSILLHELGHALVGRLFGAEVSHIELTGLGGLAHFERSLPANAFIRIAIFLAGPAANLVLWLGFDWLLSSDIIGDRPVVSLVVGVLLMANFGLFVFNLLPIFPLDGGRVAEALIGMAAGPIWAQRVVAGLGLVIAVALAAWAFPTHLWMILLAVILFVVNYQAMAAVGGFGGGRRR